MLVHFSGCRFNIGTTCYEGRSKYKCCFNSMPYSICRLLSFCEANSPFCKNNYPSSWISYFYAVFFMMLESLFWILKCLIVQETMSNEHAMRFPFVGSAMLLSLFLLFKFLSKDLVNAVLTGYFFVLGIVALSYVLSVWIMLLCFMFDIIC